jgi:hypothetical protein
MSGRRSRLALRGRWLRMSGMVPCQLLQVIWACLRERSCQPHHPHGQPHRRSVPARLGRAAPAAASRRTARARPPLLPPPPARLQSQPQRLQRSQAQTAPVLAPVQALLAASLTSCAMQPWMPGRAERAARQAAGATAGARAGADVCARCGNSPLSRASDARLTAQRSFEGQGNQRCNAGRQNGATRRRADLPSVFGPELQTTLL